MENIFKQESLIEEIPEKVSLPYPQNYGIYAKLVEDGTMTVVLTEIFNTALFPSDYLQNGTEKHIDWIINILRDGIEHPYIQNLKLNVIFADGVNLHLNIIDYLYNLFFWNMILLAGDPIYSKHVFFEECITTDAIKAYIDKYFINVYRKKLGALGATPEDLNIRLNRIIDSCLRQFFKLDAFSLYLADTINLEDDILLMKQNPRFRELYHADLSAVPIEDVQDTGMKLAYEAIDIIKNSNHCLSDSFRSKEAINPKQYKEYAINIGTAPDGTGGVYPIIVNNSFINGGTDSVPYQFTESSKGRSAQIIAKCNVGKSGHFARLLGLNNRECTILHHDPDYDCGSRNFIMQFIRSAKHLRMFENRYYRLSPNGEERLLTADDVHLIGQTIYLRSPMTCASHARGRGICYKCYGDLAYTNSSINIGQLASELLSSALTQRLLSAKHLLASAVKKLIWSKGFSDIFNVELNAITLYEDMDYSGYTLRINPDDVTVESEEDEYEYNEYIDEFEVVDNKGEVHKIFTRDRNHIYLTNDINNAIRTSCETDNGTIDLDMSKLQDKVLFLMDISNTEYSKTLEDIKRVINIEKETSSYDIHGILQRLVDTIIEGGLNTIAIHLEVILSNQIRSKDNILVRPNWDNLNEEYQIITLNKSLTENPSVTVRMSYQRLSRVLYNPISFKINQPSFIDLLFMKNPQQYMLNKQLISNEYQPKSDKEESKPLIRFRKEDGGYTNLPPVKNETPKVNVQISKVEDIMK